LIIFGLDTQTYDFFDCLQVAFTGGIQYLAMAMFENMLEFFNIGGKTVGFDHILEEIGRLSWPGDPIQ